HRQRRPGVRVAQGRPPALPVALTDAASAASPYPGRKPDTLNPRRSLLPVSRPDRSSSTIVAIGDVHGHFAEMQSLLANLRRAGVDFATDRVIWLGDYVDGGPHTAEVVDAMIAFQQEYPHWEFLKGNHEDELLQSLVYCPDDEFRYYNWYTQGGRESLLSYERHAPGKAAPHGPGAAHAVPA